jgi:hypothetical protein
MFRSLFDHLQAEYTILVLRNYDINNGSEVLYSIFHYRARNCCGDGISNNPDCIFNQKETELVSLLSSNALRMSG